MLAIRVRQKESGFYFVNYKAGEILDRVRFISRFHFEGEALEAERTPPGDDIATFIAKIERTDAAFQRHLSRRKVRDLVNFYETAETQPPIPGTVLLFTGENLRFTPMDGRENVGFITEPSEPFLIIDGQHRLAGLHFFLQRHPEEAHRLEVPTIIFDGRSSDFAAEMFVTINSTHTRINKSHLVDLLEKVTWEVPERKFAARVVDALYSDDRSPLQYKINKLGGRSRQEKWILQSELYNEVYKLVDPTRKDKNLYRPFSRAFDLQAIRAAPMFMDFFRAVRTTFGKTWGHPDYMVTKAVTLKALVRVLGDLLSDEEDNLLLEWFQRKDEEPFLRRIGGWATLAEDFRAQGFYERFPAKGQVERVQLLRNEMLKVARKGPPSALQ
jgi:DGQHR domain-containing protein